MKAVIQFMLSVLFTLDITGVIPQTNQNGNQFVDILLTNDKTYVDKSLFVKEILDFELTGKTLLITMPKRFGKTTNLLMTKTFCEIQVYDNGMLAANDPDNVINTPNYRLFTGNYTFGQLKIAHQDHSEFLYANLGKHPVAYFDFNTCAQTDGNIRSVVGCCAEVIHNAFSEHKYLLQSTRLTQDQKLTVKNWTPNLIKDLNILGKEDVENGIANLMTVLNDHFGREVIVLVDEYDALINKLVTKALSKDILEGMFNFYTKIFLVALKTNEARLRVAILTGIVPTSSWGLSNALPNLKTFRFARNKKFIQYYGFTLEEIQELFHRRENNITNLSFEQMKEYYDGYDVKGKNIYSPYSIISCLQSRRIEPFWADCGSIEYVWPALRLLKIRLMVLELHNGNSLDIETREEICLDDILILQECIHTNSIKNGDSDEIEIFFNFLLDAGYLKLNSYNHTHFNVSSANKETRLDLWRLLRTYKKKSASDKEALLQVEIGNLLIGAKYDDYFDTTIDSITNKLDQLGKLTFSQVPFYKEADLKNMIALICFRCDISFYPEGRVDVLQNPIAGLIPKMYKKRSLEKPLKQIKEGGKHGFVDFLLPNITGIYIAIETKYHNFGTSADALNQIETRYLGGIRASTHYNKTPPYDMLMLGIHLEGHDKVVHPYVTVSAKIVNSYFNECQLHDSQPSIHTPLIQHHQNHFK